jgi:hypothetical protein
MENKKTIHVPHMLNISSKLISVSLIGFSVSGECVDDAIPLVQLAAGRIYFQKLVISILVAGLLVTNGLWAAYHYGILG